MGYNRRKVILINPVFQIRFIILILCISIFVASMAFASNYYFIYKMRDLGRISGLSTDSPFFVLIERQAELLSITVSISTMISFCMIVVFGLLISHKISGPIYNIQKNISDRINKGVVRPFKFRKKDYFLDLAQSLNDYDQFLEIKPTEDRPKK